MNWKKIILIVAALALVAVLTIRLSGNKKKAAAKLYQYNKEKPITVGVDTIRMVNASDEGVYTGTFEPNRETRISADVQGRIVSLLADVGDEVKPGQALIQLDNSLLKLQLQSVNVQVEGLEADVKRFTILTRADAIQGVQLEKAQLGLKSAKVQQVSLQEQIAKTTIRAPFAGVVTAKLSEAGAFAAPGMPLLQITDISQLKFTIQVPEADILKFKLHRSFFITPDVYPDRTVPGKLTMIGSKSNQGNSFPVQFQVHNTTQQIIKAGMFGKVVVNSTSPTKEIRIPASAITGSADHAQVYLVKNGKAVLQSITFSRQVQNMVVVTSGLQEGDVVVVNGLVNLFDGAHVVLP
ncbi:MAG: efflux RND transporter periplasmic adaptor subunit [Sediminibacterium sp.]|nr:efflux RND transporter periplasmic adaptor subunit [Sediminibacterium sp.]